MAKRNLIILTKQYPFYYKEQYITNELLYLSTVYERIFLYPSDHFILDSPLGYSLPENVELIDLNLDQTTFSEVSKSRRLFLFFKEFIREFLLHENRTYLLKSIKRYYSIFAAQYSQAMALKRFLTSRNVSMEESTFYSYWFSNSALCLAILKSRGVIKEFYSRSHAIDLYHEEWSVLNNNSLVVPVFKRFKAREISRIFPISEHGNKYLKREFPDLETRVLYLGVQDFGTPSKESTNEEFLVVTCSGVDMRKRVHLLGEALSKIDRKVKWVHFGSGTNEMEQLTKNSVSSDNVSFHLMGNTPNIEIQKFYKENRVDLFVNLSYAEGVPVAIMEALSHGIPALATSVFGTPEAVIDGVTGKLIPSDFADSDLVAGIIWFMDNPDKVNDMRIGARRLFEERFNVQKNYTEFAKYLNSLP